MAREASIGKKAKILYLMQILLERTDDSHSITMSEILAALESYGITAERKSIYSDIEVLEQFGLDIIKSQEGGTYTYHVGSRQFELAELKLLVDSIQAAKFITERKSNELIKKIESLTSDDEAKQLHRQVIVSGRVKSMNESIYYNVDKLHKAINADRQIKFRYYDWDLDKQLKPRYDGMWYQLSPWALMWDDEMYYLVVYDAKHDQVTHYRVDKMKEITILDDVREGKDVFKEFNLADYTKSLFGMHAGKETKVTLEGTNYMAGVLIDRFGKDIIFAPIDDDHFRTTVNVAVSDHFLGWIASLGGMIRIVSPDSVVEQMKNMIEQLSEQYDI